jgi:ribosomal protein S6
LLSTPEAVAELDRQLSLNEAVVRTKVIRPNWSVAVKAS